MAIWRRRKSSMKQSEMTWVVVADASGGRIFSFPFKSKPWKLVNELKGDRSNAPDEGSSAGHRAGNHQGALKGHAAGSNHKEKQERGFAHELVEVLEHGMSANEFGHVVLVAPPKLLGELREGLGRGLAARVVTEVHKDYTHLTAKELQQKLFDDLPEVVA
jgi:protein required for attachment to host cells